MHTYIRFLYMCPKLAEILNAYERRLSNCCAVALDLPDGCLSMCPCIEPLKALIRHTPPSIRNPHIRWWVPPGTVCRAPLTGPYARRSRLTSSNITQIDPKNVCLPTTMPRAFTVDCRLSTTHCTPIPRPFLLPSSDQNQQHRAQSVCSPPSLCRATDACVPHYYHVLSGNDGMPLLYHVLHTASLSSNYHVLHTNGLSPPASTPLHANHRASSDYPAMQRND